MGIVRIIGVGDDGAESLGPKALTWIERADLLIGGERLLDFFPAVRARKVPIKRNVDDAIRKLESAGTENVVILASGDPNFYGIARRMVDAIGKERVEIIPNVSAVQLAFARLKESWEDARLYSVHGRDLADLVDVVRANPKIAILTDRVNSPSTIASFLLAAGLGDRRAYVCENLGSPRERIVETTLASLPGHEFSPLNVLVLLRSAPEPGLVSGARTRALTQGEREPNAAALTSASQIYDASSSAPVPSREGSGAGGSPAADVPLAQGWNGETRWTLGIPDDQFFQRTPMRGLITKAEVRVISLAKLGVREDSVVWDVGAGSGSVSVEAALLARSGRVYAIERRREDVEIILKNVARFARRNIEVVHGTAPGVLSELPNPDAVFVGGSGGQLRDIVAMAARRLGAGGRIVINLTTLENLAVGLVALRESGLVFEVTQVAIARSKAVGAPPGNSSQSLTRLEPLDPVFILSGRKQ